MITRMLEDLGPDWRVTLTRRGWRLTRSDGRSVSLVVSGHAVYWRTCAPARVHGLARLDGLDAGLLDRLVG